MINILLVDDHPAFRYGVKEILQGFSQKVEVDEAGNAKAALNCALKKEYQIAFLDISMPGRSGLDILQDLKQSTPQIKVIVHSMHAEEQYALRALKEGASGYLPKSSRLELYHEVLQNVLDGKTYFSAAVVNELLTMLNQPDSVAAHQLLTTRQYTIMMLIVQGKKLIEIAEELSISLSAVSNARSKILKTMNLSGNSELIRYAVKNNLIE
ncbi:MAG: response regulator [Calditrichia bacterium]